MADFRHITLTSEDLTESVDLNDFNGYLATSPTGFGIYRTNEFVTIGNQRIQSDNRNTFQKITLNVLILGERKTWEQKYAYLRDFISRHLNTGFRLYYTPQNDTRYIKCGINIVDKTEKDRGNLPIKLEIQPLSMWLTDNTKETIKKAVSGNLFQFNEHTYDEETYYSATFDLLDDVVDDYGRDYYAIGLGYSAPQVVTLNNAGNEETPLVIKLYGKATNPYITLKRRGTGTVSQYIKFNNLTVNNGYYLEINSDPLNTHIELVNNITGEKFDRESYADIESNMYITLPVGEWDIEFSTEDVTETGAYAVVFFANRYYGG